MDRVTLVLGVIFLLRGGLAEPKPDFGLSVTIDNGDQVNSAVDLTETVVQVIIGITLPSATTSGNPNLVTTLSVLQTVITEFTSYANGILSSYEALYAATDGDISTHFGALESAIDAATSYITGNAVAATVTILQGIHYDGIADELYDEFSRLNNGLLSLKQQVLTMQDALSSALAANNGNPNVPTAILTQFVTPMKTYNLIRIINTVRAYLPVVEYTLETAIENFQMADAFITALQGMLADDASSLGGEIEDTLRAITNKIEDDLESGVEALVAEAQGIVTTVQGLTSIAGATDYPTLMDSLNVLATLDVSAAGTELGGKFDDIFSAEAALVAAVAASKVVNTQPTVTTLIDTLMGNDEYGRYCYEKYKDLVVGILTNSINDAYECTDKELIRLEYLLQTLLGIFELVHFDTEDVDDQIAVCAALTDATAMNQCITDLSGYYAVLFGETQSKVNLIYDIAIHEAIASKNRLLICMEIAYLEEGVSASLDLVDDIHYCAMEGPAGIHE